ncbi:FtsX-like permease family protein [Streptomyces sp. NPDC051776]|uniref:FtsX-like permease family protein n=1 Tax=Streptomyces sp. NPDC051776 TaxID=3155414 RepID=UPI003415C4DA
MSGTLTGPPAGTRTAPGDAPARAGFARWAGDLAMGARFALTGGRESWARTLLTAIGVGLGVTLLLTATAVPSMIAARDARTDARSTVSGWGEEIKPGPDTLQVLDLTTTFHDKDVLGMAIHPEGPNAPMPPGISEFPGQGEMTVSPALADLLNSSEGKLLRERLPDRITGTIGKEGLSGPGELLYYQGAAKQPSTDRVYRIDHFGRPDATDPLPPELLLLVIIACVVLLLPVAIFIATAVRFGGERRDRRLAALRLVGADARMVRRIAAGEAMVASVAGLAVGCAVFLVARQFAGSVSLWDMTVFPSDVTPALSLALLIAVAVPVSAVLVTLFALRGVTIEPLGVVRIASTRPRRLWWRLAIPALGLALLLPKVGGFTGSGDLETYQVAAGAVLLLIGVTAVLPWLVEAVVNRFTGGPLPWQLATRRLQLSSGTASRAVSGITIAVAGAIAIQMLFASAESNNTMATGQDTSWAQIQVSTSADSREEADRVFDRIRDTRGVKGASPEVRGQVSEARKPKNAEARSDEITVADCWVLRRLLRISACRDGDVFVTPQEEDFGFAEPGMTVDLTGRLSASGKPEPWRIPASAPVVEARVGPLGYPPSGIFATPSAVDVGKLREASATILVRLDPDEPEAAEYVRNTAAAISTASNVMRLSETAVGNDFATIRRGLFIGATATLVLIGASMIVSMLEQLRERKRLLSVLVAFGTRRPTVGWSVFWQTAVPVALGLGLSVAGGVALGAVLLKLVNEPVAVDWSSLGTMTAFGAAVILLVTLVSMPPLWRMMRPDGLRTE